VHIEIREKGGSKKYYLAYSFRDGRSVKKIRIFLGRDLAEETLKERAKNAEKELQKRVGEAKAIRDPFLTVLSPVELKELETLEARGELHVRHLSEADWTKFKETFTYNTNAIEGSCVNAAEVQNILENQEWPQDKSKEDIAETFGVAEAVDYIRTTDEHISLKLIKELHGIVFKNSKPYAGAFRPKGVEMVVADVYGNVVHRGSLQLKLSRCLKK